MIRMLRRPALVVFLVMIIAARVTADEGMWLLDQLKDLPAAQMKKYGLELTPEQIYNTNGPSLKDAIILLSGGTASFISPDGLILTNHHVAFAGIQSVSSVKNDYLKNGFSAGSRDEEIPTSYTATLVLGMRDVTNRVLSGINDSLSADDRTREIRSRKLEIEESEADSDGISHSVVEMYNGLRFYLFTFRQLPDVRLAYAPPSAIGNFGGETDNWMWPRHTGDFSLLRAYVGPDGRPAKYAKENIPYRPKVFLPISTHGYREGSFAMILGFPGKTFRHQEIEGVKLAYEETLPTTIDLYKARIETIENGGKANRAVAIKYAARLRRLTNTYKKSLGILEGMRRANLLTAKQSEETALADWIVSNPDRARGCDSLLIELNRANHDLGKVNRKNLFFSNLTQGVSLLGLANRFSDHAHAVPQDSLGKAPDPAARRRRPLGELIASTFRNFDLVIDRETLRTMLLKSFELPMDQQPACVREIVGNDTGREREQKINTFVEDLYASSMLVTQEACEELLTKEADKILDDPWVKFGERVWAEHTATQTAVTRINETLDALRARYVRVLLAWRDGAVHYPDANRSLRFTFGRVRSLLPRDAVRFSYVTTLTGIIEKEESEDPFVVPPKLKELWQKKDFGRYADTALNDVPVGFIADLDITGGNSGSPVLNGKGELIGCAFDGNWEGVVGDYRYDGKYNRTISLDARYLLFILDKFSGATRIVKELVIR
jgi:hypothetical protein